MTRFYPILVILSIMFAVSCTPSVAQVPVLQGQGTVKNSVQIMGQFDNPPYSTKDVYTVPPNSYLRITDMIFTNYSSDKPCDVGISSKTYEIRIQPNSTIAINLLSGPTFGPGENVTLFNTWRLPGHGNSCTPIYTIMGYLYTVP